MNQTEYLNATSMLKTCHVETDSIGSRNSSMNEDGLDKPCGYLMAYFGLPDVWLGVILLVFSLFLLSMCLVILVKILNSMMQDKMATVRFTS